MQMKPHPDSIKAGKIAARVLSEVAKEAVPGVSVLKICTLAEQKLLEYGASGLAFPCNVSINEEAAHYTSPRGDTRVLPDSGLVKIDLGAHVNGFLSDTALTVDLDGSYERFIAASKDALDKAIETIRPGVRLGEIGAVIERTIRHHGLNPVYHLSGHQMTRWTLHAGKSVPNIGTADSTRVQAGQTYAIEPFSTDGSGAIMSGTGTYIYSNVMNDRHKLDRLSREFRDVLRRRFGTLPWASRWISSKKYDVDALIHTLALAGAIHGYPVLIESKRGMVSQFEHTIFVGPDGPVVTTQRDASSQIP
ncbi:MAG: type II methionyl aminopeptidase [Candidatus Thorarchaeota archaeon]|nr:type II methionyl aminopeptidase [Candidatus Thorarchaeota archaeon]